MNVVLDETAHLFAVKELCAKQLLHRISRAEEFCWRSCMQIFKETERLARFVYERKEMAFMQTFLCIIAFANFEKSLTLSVHDPRLSPGHLKPLGTGRPKYPIEIALDYPSPQGMPVYDHNICLALPLHSFAR